MSLSRPASVFALAFTPQARHLLWSLTHQPGLVVVHGHPQSSRLAHYFLAGPLLRREAVLFLDAANCFNPYRLVGFARQCRRSPGEFLRQVRISRAFTCFQLAELIERTPAAARRYGARRIVLTGIPDIFDDEELRATEVGGVFRRTLACLQRWPSRSLTALAFSDACPTEARPRRLGLWLHRQLARQAAAVYRLEESPAGLALLAEKQPLAAGSYARRTLPARRAETNHEATSGRSAWVEPSPLFTN